MSQIIIGYTVEGNTDVAFLSSIIQRTFVEIGFECKKDIEVVEPLILIEKVSNDSFVNKIEKCCIDADNKGVMAFCIHVDADDNTDLNVFEQELPLR